MTKLIVILAAVIALAGCGGGTEDVEAIPSAPCVNPEACK